MKKIILIIISISVLLVLFIHAIEPVEPIMREWELVPKEKAAKMDMSGAHIEGMLRDSDRNTILALVSRVKGINPKIQKVELCWEDFTAAARITTENKEVYLTVSTSMHWEIIKVVKILY